MAYREPTRENQARTVLHLIIYTAVLTVEAFFLIPGGAPGAAVSAVIFVAGAFLLIRWHATNTTYRCRLCAHEFRI